MNTQATRGARTIATADIFINHEIHANPDQLYRARVLVLILFVQLCIHALLILGATFSRLLSEAHGVVVPMGIGSCVAILYSLYLLKVHGNYSACCLLAVAQSFIAVTGALVVTGGPNASEVGQLLAVPCLMAYFFGGVRWGVTLTVITIATLITMLLLQTLGVAFPQLSAEAFKSITPVLVLTINFALVTALSLIYEVTHFSVKKERDQQHQKFVRLAKIDPLTGLANRRVFDEILAAKIALFGTLSPVRSFALCYLDLDSFKPINDQFGHDIGDEVLNAVSTRLRSALRGADFICRHGGDEFLMLLDSVTEASAAQALSQRFLHLIHEPINTSGGVMQIGASLGFALFPLHGDNVISLQKAADSAMYEAKRRQCSFVLYNAALLGNSQ